MVDRLAALLNRFSVSAHTFHAGALCGINVLEAREPYGQLHLIRGGTVEVHHDAVRRLHEHEVQLAPAGRRLEALWSPVTALLALER